MKSGVRNTAQRLLCNTRPGPVRGPSRWLVLLALYGTLTSTSLTADDWPHWMGPQRDNVWRETGLLDKFPAGGPKVVWRTPIAGGYAGPAVSQGKLVVQDYVTADNVKVDNFERQSFTGTERVLCLDEQTGKILWKHEYPVKYTVSYPSGPRCTPTFDGEHVYTLGTEGHLFCFKVATGEIVWSKDLVQEYNTKTALWGYASHPLIDGEKLICVVGGEGSHAVAFNKKTGKELWRSLSAPEQGYCPPVIVELGGLRQLLLPTPTALNAVDPETGKLYWTTPYEASNGSIIMTPVQSGNHIYLAGFSNKNLLVEVAADGRSIKEVVYRDLLRKGISPVNVQPFLIDDALYGFDQNGMLICMDLKSGERLWQTAKPFNSERPVGSGTAFIVKQGDRFWMFNELGELMIVRLSREGFEELDRVKVIDQTNTAFGREVVWSMPAFANKRAYIRNDAEIICVDLSK